MSSITVRAPAKINLCLHVTGKRDDGYHLLDSIVVFADDIADIISIQQDNAFSFSASGPFAGAIEDDNLATRAAKMYFQATGRKQEGQIHLEKNIPLGAGLGGGSADAAATIRALESLYAPLDKGIRDKILIKLGADVPVCYESAPCQFRGIGDDITPVPTIPPLSLVLIWPDTHSSTKEVFSAREKPFSMEISVPEEFGNERQFVSFLKSIDNDLAAAAECLSPSITLARQFLESQSGCLLARMSGSGSCVFGVFETPAQCFEIQTICQTLHPSWWVKTGNI